MQRGTANIERSAARLSISAGVLGVIGGVLALVVAVLGVWSWVLNNSNAELESQVKTLRTENEDLGVELKEERRQVVSLNEDIDGLERQIRELRMYAPTVPTGGAREIRMAATVTLAADGDTIKLNSARPNFEIGPENYDMNEVFYDGEWLRIRDGFGGTTDFVVLASGVADYDTCSVAQGWSNRSRFDPGDLLDGDVCLRLDNGRYAVIDVDTYDDSAIKLSATVWK